MQEIRQFGRLPRHVRGTEPDPFLERSLAERFVKARDFGKLTSAQEAELHDLEASGAVQPAAEHLMQEIRDFGRKTNQINEQNLPARRVSARTSGELTAAQGTELAGLRRQFSDYAHSQTASIFCMLQTS